MDKKSAIEELLNETPIQKSLSLPQSEIVLSSDVDDIICFPLLKKAKVRSSIVTTNAIHLIKPKRLNIVEMAQPPVGCGCIAFPSERPLEITLTTSRNFCQSLFNPNRLSRQMVYCLKAQLLYRAHIWATHCAQLAVAYEHVSHIPDTILFRAPHNMLEKLEDFTMLNGANSWNNVFNKDYDACREAFYTKTPTSWRRTDSKSNPIQYWVRRYWFSTFVHTVQFFSQEVSSQRWFEAD